MTKVEIKSKPVTPGGVLSIDPGVRTFMTGYDSNGYLHEWGCHESRSRLCRLSVYLDRIQSRISAIKNKRRKSRLKRALRRGHAKIRSLVDEMHKKLAKWICENFSVVLLPEFKVKSIVSRWNRRISNKSVRSMCTWSHFRFKQHLHHKAREYTGVHIKDVTEEWTSKTCSCCGNINDRLGRSKVFKCPHCDVVMDRDANGAKNILIKYLTEHNILL